MHNVITKMVDVECAKCNLLFSVTSDFRERRKDDHETFYCPQGHSNYWPQQSDKEKLKRQLSAANEKAKRERIERQFHENSAKAYKGRLTRTKKRIAAGVCPCCNRTFKNVARHMKGQHPHYVK